jgi:Phage integrase SAM-like domain
MGQIRKINGIFYIEFHARGLLYSQVAGNSLVEAQKLLLQVEEKIAGGEALTISRHIDLPDFFERFMAEAGSRYSHSPQTVRRFASTIKHFSGFLEENFTQVRQIAQLTPAVLESYKVYLVKTQKTKTVNLTVLLLRDVLEFGIKLGFLNDNPSLHVRLLPWPKTPQRRITPRYELAGELLSQGVGLGKLAQLLKLPDISRAVYYADLIPLSREDEYR